MAFHVYRSSAGSGKTYTLVKEYLAIVVKEPSSFRNILAITFTNKAANEMRDRILRSLTEISDPGKYHDSNAVKYMLPDLMETTGLDGPLISRNAAKVLSMILHNYQDFAVSTIDSFIHRIIRTFAFDLHLPLNFEVEVDANTMVTQAVDLLLSKVGVDDAPTKALSGFTESLIQDEKSWAIEGALKDFSKRLLSDDIVDYLPALQKMDTMEILKVSSALNSFCKGFEEEVSKIAGRLLDLWTSNGITEKDMYYGNSGIYGYIKRLSNRNLSGIKPKTYVKATLGEDLWYKKDLADDRKAVIDSLKDEMISIVSLLLSYSDENLEQYNLYNILKRNIFPLAVLNEILMVMDQIRENDGIIHISEFDKRIARVVNHEPIPFIYERLGEKYQHFLIDEFQDTSVLEWQNILPLIENTLSEAHFNMIVGDAKQAIYRFKGGEVEQLVALPEIFRKPDTQEMAARENILRRNYEPHALTYNFRSREEIISFNNDFYDFCAGLLPENLREIYADCKQEMKVKNPGGEIQITFIDIPGKKADKEETYFNNILQTVNDLKLARGYSYQDIAILCRSNDEASKIARNLLINGIEVVSAESLLLSSSPEVNFLLSCLNYIANTDDKLSLTGILTYLAGRKENGSLHEVLRSNLLPDSEKPEEDNEHGIDNFLGDQNIKFKIEVFRQMGLYERVESLIRLFSLHASPDPYIVFFLDAVYDYSMNKRFLPEDFTTFWEENKHRYSIVVPEGMDAVKVMTIHKAKGLEFPVVIFPFANDRVKIRNEHEWVQINDDRIPALKTALLPVNKSLEETEYAGIYENEWNMQQLDMLNILYVATTRPAERLFIVCDMPVKDAEEIKDIPGLLKAYLEHCNLWENDKMTYLIGDDSPLEQIEKKPMPSVYPNTLISGDWRKNVLLSGHAAEYWDLDDESRNLEWGNLVHQVLSKVNTMDDLAPAVQSELNKGNITEDKAVELLQGLKSILSSEEINGFFDGNYLLKNEAGIMNEGGDEYRPDRLMIKDDVAIVLDYKTGKEDEKYIRQIDRYAGLLSEMGFKKIERYLLYLGKDHVLREV